MKIFFNSFLTLHFFDLFHHTIGLLYFNKCNTIFYMYSILIELLK